MTIKSGTTLVTCDDQDTNTSPNPSFDSVLRARLSRRSLLKGTMGLAAGTFFGGSPIACGDDESPAAAPLKTLKFDFTAVGKSLADTVVVPPGYTASVLDRRRCAEGDGSRYRGLRLFRPQHGRCHVYAGRHTRHPPDREGRQSTMTRACARGATRLATAWECATSC